MIKEIVAHIKTDDLEILFRLDSGYFDDDIITTIESAGCKYLIKRKEYPTLASQVTAPSISFIKGGEGRETTELVTKLDTWDKDRRFVLEGEEYEYFYFVTNAEMSSEKNSYWI